MTILIHNLPVVNWFIKTIFLDRVLFTPMLLFFTNNARSGLWWEIIVTMRLSQTLQRLVVQELKLVYCNFCTKAVRICQLLLKTLLNRKCIACRCLHVCFLSAFHMSWLHIILCIYVYFRWYETKYRMSIYTEDILLVSGRWESVVSSTKLKGKLFWTIISWGLQQ